jgi:hypothetical protein
MEKRKVTGPDQNRGDIPVVTVGLKCRKWHQRINKDQSQIPDYLLWVAHSSEDD